MIWVVVIVAAVVVAAAAASSSSMFNRLVRLRNRAENAWAQVDVQLRKRYDLIPNLVETVKGYAAHERETFEAVTRRAPRRSRPRASPQQAQAENMLTQALGKLFAVAEAYPQLRATENFQQLQAQLADDRDKIAVSRQVYNDTVLTYNNAIQTVPTSIIAGMFNFQAARVLRDRGGGAREAPHVSFTAPPAASPPPATPEAPADPAAGPVELTGLREQSRWRRARRARPARAGRRGVVRLPQADVAVQVAAGRLAARQRAHHDRADAFHGGYRDIPLRDGESIDHVAVSERRHGLHARRQHRARPRRTRPGRTATSRAATASASSGTSRRPASSRTFTISYRFRGLAVAYDDVVDVNLKVWGDEWAAPLGDLRATLTLPAPPTARLQRLGPPGLGARRSRAHGRRRRRCTRSTSRPTSSSSCASLFPRCAVHARQRGAKVQAGNGAGADRRRGAGDAGRTTSATSERIDEREAPPRRMLLYLLLLGLGARARALVARLLALRPRARDRLRPRVRAGAADRHRAGARARAPPPGRDAPARTSSRRRSST